MLPPDPGKNRPVADADEKRESEFDGVLQDLMLRYVNLCNLVSNPEK